MNLQMDSPLLLPSLILGVLSILCYIWKLNKSGKKMLSFPPGPRALPIVGYLPFLRDDMHIQFTELARKYGPIYKFWLGNKLCFVISKPSLIKELLRDHDTVFANRDSTVTVRIASNDGNNVGYCPYGPEWRARRKVFVYEFLSNSSLDASVNLRKDEVRKAVRNVYSKIGTPVEISKLSYEISINAIMSMVWGSTIIGKRKDDVRTSFLPLVSRSFDVLAKPNVSDYFPFLERLDIQGIGREMKGVMQKVEKIIDDIMDERMKEEGGLVKKEGRLDFLQLLVELKEKEDAKMPLNRTQVRGMIIDAVIGGTDTSSTTTEWVMAELMNNPDVMEKVQKELNEVVGVNNIVEEFHVPKLVYLDAVLKETLRVHPIGPFLTPRTPSQTCTVGGYTIPKGSAVFINVWYVQRDPLAWDNPLEFKPERFLENNGKWDFNGNNFNYIPFGSGRRVCAGLPLVERMVRYVLASLVHSFQWQLPKGEKLDMSDKFGLVLRKRKPLIAIPVPRLSSSNLYE